MIDHDQVPNADSPHTLLESERVGAYRLLDLLGEGGMGEVWLAEAVGPIRRHVALKIIKIGMDTRETIARFESERQALAMMDHPSIARIFEGGATPSGRLFFAMELVRGVPITDYCDTNRLTIQERVRLFVNVCRAVQHAHQKGVIHRDLKPSNVLVTVSTEGPVPKIIDFGIAKAVGGRFLTDKTLHTRYGQMIGTPAYMSPEQADNSGLDVDSRSDIYSLGVMLYEILSGALPFDPAPGTPLQYAIREREILRPSTMVTTLRTKALVAERRRTTSKDLRRSLRGDLDWIVLRATETDRTRRYEAASGLALDLERYLSRDPVAARPPTASYRLRKLVSRHRASASAAGVAVVALMVGAGAATTGFVRARRAEARAQEDAAAARQTSEFLVSIFRVSDPSEGRGTTITTREILDRGAARVRTELLREPALRARLMMTMAEVYSSLGLYDAAEGLAREALATSMPLHGAQHPLVAAPLSQLGAILHSRGRGKSADSALSAAAVLQARLPARQDTALATTLSRLATVRGAAGRYAEADSLVRRSLAIRERVLGPDDVLVALTLADLAYLHDDDPSYAEPLLRRAYETALRSLGESNPRVLEVANQWALALVNAGRYGEAQQLFETVTAARERVFGPQHAATGAALTNLAMAQVERGEAEGAATNAQRAVAILEKAYGPVHLRLGWAWQQLAHARFAQGQMAAAESAFVRAVATLAGSAGPTHNYTRQAEVGLGKLYAATGRLVLADSMLRQALAGQEKIFGKAHQRLLEPLVALADVAGRMSRPRVADSLYRRAVVMADSVLMPGHPHRLHIQRQYTAFLRASTRSHGADSTER